MNRRTFIVLLGAIIVMSAMLLSNRPDSDNNEAPPLLAGLDNELNDITRVTIKAAGNRTVATMVRGPERWTIAERSNYPADIGKIRGNLIALANATVVEEKTADPALYARLGVEDIASETATGVELIIDSPHESYRIIIGKIGVRGEQAYARQAEAAVSLLIRASLDLGTTPTDWLDRAIIDIPASKIFRVTTTHQDGETLQLEKTEPDADNFKLVNQPAESELAFPGVTNAIGAVLTELELDDVMARRDVVIDNDQPIVTRFETFDGLIITTNIYTNDEQKLVSFAFSTSDQEEAANDTATARAAKLAARLSNWLFVLPNHEYDELTRHMSDLLSQQGPPQAL